MIDGQFLANDEEMEISSGASIETVVPVRGGRVPRDATAIPRWYSLHRWTFRHHRQLLLKITYGLHENMDLLS